MTSSQSSALISYHTLEEHILFRAARVSISTSLDSCPSGFCLQCWGIVRKLNLDFLLISATASTQIVVKQIKATCQLDPITLDHAFEGSGSIDQIEIFMFGAQEVVKARIVRAAILEIVRSVMLAS